MKDVSQQHIGEQRASETIPPYEPPTVVTYHDDDLLAELGPAQACSFSGSVVGCPTEYQQWLRERGYPAGAPDP